MVDRASDWWMFAFLPAALILKSMTLQKDAYEFRHTQAAVAIEIMSKRLRKRCVVARELKGTITSRFPAEQSDLASFKAVLERIDAGYDEFNNSFYVYPKKVAHYTFPISIMEAFRRPVPDIQFRSEDIVTAFRKILDATHVSYVIHPGIHGEVNLAMHNTTAGEVFWNLIDFSNAVNRFRDGVFHLYPRREFFTADGKEIEAHRADYDFEDVEIRRVMSELCYSSGARFSISPDAQARITLHIRKAKFEDALRMVIEAADLTYRFEKGVALVLKPDLPDRSVPPIRFDHVDLRQAIKELCRAADASYSLGEGVEGIVDLNLPKSKLGKDLHALLDPAGCTYIYEGGVFAIFRDPQKKRTLKTESWKNKPADQALFALLKTIRANFWISPRVTGKINLRIGDRSFENELDDLLAQTNAAYRYDEGVFVIFPKREPPPEVKLPNLDGLLDGTWHYVEYHNADIREVLKTCFQQLNAPYVIDARVKGTVTFSARQFPIEATLDYICLSANARWRREGEVTIIEPRTGNPPR